MICKKCGNQLSENALFCPKCGQKTDNQVQNMGVSTQPNVNSVSPVNHSNSEGTHQKKHTVRTVLLSVVATIIVLFGGLMWIGSHASDDAGVAGTSSSSALEQKETNDSAPPANTEAASVSSPEAEAEYLGYVDQALELCMDTYQNMDSDDDTDDTEYIKKERENFVNLLSKVSDLQRQAASVKGIDVDLVASGTEYFNLMCDAQKAMSEMYTFMVDYLDFLDSITNISQVEAGDSIEDYYNNYMAFFESMQENYLAIDSCPPSLESEWERYGEALSLCETILYKQSVGQIYSDPLRMKSAENLLNRFLTVFGVQNQKIIDRLSLQTDHALWQLDLGTELAGEMHAYAELGAEERSNVSFESTDEIALAYEVVDTIYPSLYNTYDAFLIINTGCASGTKKIVVEAEIPGLTQAYKESFALDAAYTAIYVKPPALTGDLDLSSVKDAQVNVTISDQDGTLIEAKTFPITIQSKYDVDWYTDEYGIATQDNILCFLTPEASAISDLKRQAIEEISSMTGGQMESFVGYQETGWSHYVGTYLQTAGIMRALCEMGVRYNMDNFSVSSGHQHVLLPEDVLNQRSGLCIETSLVVASALQSAGMHAFLVFPPGHAQVAVEVWDGRGENTSGTGEYFLIETTALSNNINNESVFVADANALVDGQVLNESPIIYMNQEGWNSYLSNQVEYLIDCDDSRVLGLTPFTN